MNKAVLVQYVGFECTPEAREYVLHVTSGDGSRRFTVSIPHAAFAAHRARYQDAPDICFLKLQRELAAHDNRPEEDHMRVTDAELEAYREAQARRSPQRRARGAAVPH